MLAHVCFVLMLVFGAVSLNEAYDVDGQYAAFEGERGAKATQTAQSIADALGLDVAFGDDVDKDAVKAELLKALMLHFFDEGDLYKTVSYGEEAVTFYREKDAMMDLAGTYITLGNAYQRMGCYDDAIRSYNLCSATMDEIGGPMAKVNKRYVLNNMAVMYLEMDEYELAEEMWNKCIASVNEPDPGFLPQYNGDSLRSLDLATYYQNLAEVRMAQAKTDDAMRTQRIEEAIRFSELSLDLSERYGAEQGKVVARLKGLAQACFAAGRTDEATRNMDAALRMVSTAGDRYMQAALHLLKGEMELAMNHADAAESHYLEALVLARGNHFGALEMDALNGAYECTKDHSPQRALAYFTESTALKDSIYNKEQQALVRDFEVKYKMEEKEHELALQREKNRQSRRLLALSLVVVVLLLVLLLVGMQIGIRRKRRNALKDHLLFVVAHDIKAPVITQAQLSEMTCEHFDDMAKDEIKENLQVLKVSSDELSEKMQNIIYWVRGEMDKAESLPQRFALRDLADEVVADMASHIRMKSLAVVNSIPVGWECLDDANIVRMVLQNLLSNAVKFSWPKGEIGIDATEAAGFYWVAVSDKGMGIAKEKQQRLFNDVVTYTGGTAGEMGTGIGLFVTKQLLDRKGGQIRMESVEGQGTTVSFTVNKA